MPRLNFCAQIVLPEPGENMKTCRRPLSAVCLNCRLILASVARSFAQEKVDLDMIHKIRYEGFHNSKIMQLANGLFEEIGARLTGSPHMKRANEWTRDKLTEFGLVNAHLEPWTPFGRGWSNEYINVRMIAPDVAPLIAYSKAWTPGTNGEVRGSVVRVKITGPQDVARYKGKLAGKIVLLGDDAEVKLSTEPLAQRHSEKTLGDLSQYQIPGDRNDARIREFQNRARQGRAIAKFFEDEKGIALVDHSRGGINGGTVFVQQGGSHKTGQTSKLTQVTPASQHWSRRPRPVDPKAH